MNVKKVKKDNQDWKANYLENLESVKEENLSKLINIKNEYMRFTSQQKFDFLFENIFELSLSTDIKTINQLESMGVGGIVHKYFVNADEIFEMLDKFYEKSIYLFPYGLIWGYYEALSKLFFFYQLSVNFGYDLSKVFNSLYRKEKNGTLEVSLVNQLEQLKKMDEEVSKENTGLRIVIDKEMVSSTIRKSFTKPQKITLYNLFVTLKDNSLASPIDKRDMKYFYRDFYDLMAILLRDKSILNDNPDSDVRSKYNSDDRFKAKRVKSLLKLAEYGDY